MFIVETIKLETGLRPNSAWIPYTLLSGIGAIGFQLLGFYCSGSAFVISVWGLGLSPVDYPAASYWVVVLGP